MKKIIKQIFIPLSCFLFLVFLFFNMDKITDQIVHLIKKEPDIVIEPKNDYSKKETFLFVKQTENFVPLSKQDIMNIFYTIVNNGWKKFTFYCPNEYVNCLNDVKEFSQNQDLLTHLNNFVHPFNGFSNVRTVISENGSITITVDYFYKEEEIKQINKKLNEIAQEILNDTMNTREKIEKIHDYIINTTKYDIERNNENSSKYRSYIAYGPLFEGFATCNGYTDAMALFLIKLNIPNFKVAMTPEKGSNSAGHVWNAIYIDNQWLHLDLTWDDPVSKDGKDYLQHKYFLITTSQLKSIDEEGEVKITEHDFKKNIYLELKEKNY